MAGEGLEDVVAGKTAISTIDGKKGILAYRGISIHDLADHSTFEETTYLLWYGRLPTHLELRRFCEQIWKEVFVPKDVLAQLRTLNPDANAMSLLRTGVSLLGLSDPLENETVDPEMPAPGVQLIGQLSRRGRVSGPTIPTRSRPSASPGG